MSKGSGVSNTSILAHLLLVGKWLTSTPPSDFFWNYPVHHLAIWSAPLRVKKYYTTIHPFSMLRNHRSEVIQQ